MTAPALPFHKRISFGMGGLTIVLPDLVIMQWLLVRYVPGDGPPLIPPVIFGVLVLLGRLAEGVTNPVAGHASDMCRHRWGRRMPFLRLGIVPYTAAFFLLFNPPCASTWGNAAYAAVLLLVYFTSFAVIGSPYLALLPEISVSSRERVDLMTIQSVFMMLGTFAFAGVGVLRDRFGWTVMAGAVAAAACLFFVPVMTAIREAPQKAGPEWASLPLGRSLALTLRNRPFRFVVASTSVYWFGLSGLLALAPVWVRVYLAGRDSDVTLLMAPYLLSNLVFFFVFNALSRRYGKYPLMLAAFLGTSAVVALLPLVGLFPVGSPFLQTALIFALAGAPVAGFMVLPFVVLADVVDFDAREHGLRREAVFFGAQGIFQKLAIGTATIAFTVVPYLGGDGHAMTPFGLKLMAGLCACAGLGAFLIFLGYPLRETA